MTRGKGYFTEYIYKAPDSDMTYGVVVDADKAEFDAWLAGDTTKSIHNMVSKDIYLIPQGNQGIQGTAPKQMLETHFKGMTDEQIKRLIIEKGDPQDKKVSGRTGDTNTSKGPSGVNGPGSHAVHN